MVLLEVILVLGGLFWGFLLDRFWFQPFGKAQIQNMIGRSQGIVILLTNSKRIRYFVTDFSKKEWSHQDKLYMLSEGKRFYIGNVSAVFLIEGNAHPLDVMDRTDIALCKYCQSFNPLNTVCENEECQHHGESQTVSVPIVTYVSGAVMNSYLIELWAQLRAMLNSKFMLYLMAAAFAPVVILAAWGWLAMVSAPNTDAVCVSSAQNVINSVTSVNNTLVALYPTPSAVPVV